MFRFPTQLTKTLLIVSAFSLGAIALPAQADDDDAGFTRGITLKIDGKRYVLAGVPDAPNGNTDIPGHSWAVIDKDQLVGRHVNTGPFGASQWWSSDAADGALLYNISGVIDSWSEKKAVSYHNRGYVHYHELLSVEDGSPHPEKVLWLRHAAVTNFTLDGGPHPELTHAVTPGVDFRFIPNWNVPYPGGS